MLLSTVVQAQTTYYWVGAGADNNWSTAANWNTTLGGGGSVRNPATNDILVFSGGTPTVAMDINQTIGRLSFIGTTTATLNSPLDLTRTVTITGDAADNDLFIGSGSSVSLVGNLSTGSKSAGVLLALGTSATGSVAGDLKLNSTGGNGPSNAVNKLQSTTAGSLHFTSPGKLIIADRMSSTAFTNAPVFETGSTLEQNAANSSDHGPLATYQPGSTFRYVDGTFGGASLTTDRTFGNLEFASSNPQTIGGAVNLTIANNLAITGSANLTLSARGSATGTPTGTLIGGNVSNTNATATLTFSPSTAAPNTPKVVFNGTSPQTISSAGPLTFGTNAKLEINNSAGVTLQKDLIIASELLLTNGLLTTSAAGTGLLTMTAAATLPVGSGSSTSFVNGPLARLNATGTSTLVFPVGKVATNGDLNYRPITLALTSQTNSVTYTAQQFEASAKPFGVSGPIDHVSTRRYFTVAASATPTGGSFNARITLSYATDDYVTNATTTSLVVAKRNGGAWASIGSTNVGTSTTASSTPLTGTLTSGTFTSFSDFTLASTTPNVAGTYPGFNPLPVELTRFEATAKGAGVNLTWATASEKNSDQFEIQRSVTGSEYATIGTAKGQGSTIMAHEYSFVDGRPLAGTSYYRLRQVDADGTFSYSPVAAVQTEASTKVELYPNPSANQLILPTGVGAVQYRIFNALGQLLLNGRATDNDRLDISSLPKGPFFLELSSATGHHTQRLLRE
ncbi:hypothetical protein ACVWYF_001702 [Hymenobacter sp. UYAg731]